ncbi:MAG: DUF2339 domain-containing protein [Acidobacteriaceae bacterium]|nr:DUF2339 domain-containing protein [Acidobacteriaceae bacterium]MBV9780319.1 DUF2339 domain-containing protein [Acidobacteriaceae bacterium]
MASPEQERLDVISSAIAGLLKRQDQMEQRLSRLEERFAPAAAVPAVTPLVESASTSEPQNEIPSVTATKEIFSPPRPAETTPPRSAFETRVGLTLLNRVGVITLVLGVAFFFKWAVDNNWIGPRGRVILGILAALAALGIADWLWRKGQHVFAQGVTGFGIGIFFLSIYAAFGFYHLIPQALAFLSLFAGAALCVALSLRYGSQAIAALGFFGGYLTPLLLSTGEDHPWFLLSYVLLLDIAAVLLSVKRRWRGLELLSFLATVILYSAWLTSKFPADKERLAGTLALLAYLSLYARVSLRELFLLGQFLVALALADLWANSAVAFFALSLIPIAGGLAYSEFRKFLVPVSIAFASFWLAFGAWRSFTHPNPNALTSFAGITLAFLLFFAWNLWHLKLQRQPLAFQSFWLCASNPAIYYAVAYALLNPDYRPWLGLLAVAVAGLYIASAAYFYSTGTPSERPVDTRPVILSFGIAICFLILAVPIQFTGFTITVAWSLQAAALAWIAVRFTSPRLQWLALSVFAFAALRLIAVDAWMFASHQSYVLLWNSRMLTFAVAAASLLFASRWSVQVSRPIALAEYFAGHLALLFGLTLEIIGWAERSIAPQNLLSVETFAVSILFAIYAVMLVSIGVGTRSAVNRIAGLALIGIVIVKLYLFDVWQLQRVYRISAFVALGVLLLGTSFVYSHWRQLIEKWWKDDEARY